jgi:hypothetical protein
MNNVEELLKLLIPAFFLVLWALNQLLNKESNAPQAPGRPGGLGPRPGVPPTPRPAMERPREVPVPPRPQTTPAGRDDEIVILRSETVRPPAPGNVRRGQRARPGRGVGRQGAAPAARTGYEGKAETRSLIEMRPTQGPVETPQETLRIGVPSPISADDLRSRMRSLDRVREAILLNEILQPPVSLRRPGRG